MDGFIELESHAHVSNGGLRKAVVLTERTVVDLSFEDGAWKQTVLERDADERHHLEEALGQLKHHWVDPIPADARNESRLQSETNS